MAGSRRFLVLLKLLILTQGVLCSKLNVPRVLLPVFNDIATSFLLEATDDGCYKWTTTRTDIVHLKPDYTDSSQSCSSKAEVKAITKERQKSIAVVLAEDIHTGQTLRCVVIVDVIESLNIITKTRELLMDESPEAFEVRACDAQGNEFTTLQNIEFDWSINTGGQVRDLPVLRFMTFEDSPYETPPSILHLEMENKQGHIVLVEGVKTGSAKVSVKLPYDEYKHLSSSDVQLSVIANLIIMPSEVFIMVGDIVTFQVIHMHNGRLEKIELSNSQYYLDVENNEVALMEKPLDAVKGKNLGRTKVILHDRYAEENDTALKLPSACVSVVESNYITLGILPYRNWAILLSEHHDIVAEVFTSDNHKIHLGKNVQIEIKVGRHFHVEQKTNNGSWLTGWAILEGTTTVQAKFIGIQQSKAAELKVSAQAELQIFPNIILIPSDVILPWDSQTKPKYDFEIIAKGGDGKFLWSSENNAIGVVTQSGNVRTQGPGQFQVSAAMIKNHHNRESARVHIVPPTELQIVEYLTEAEVGSVIFLHVALYVNITVPDGESKLKMPFTKCQDLPFLVKSSDPNFTYNKTLTTTPLGISCGNLAILSNSVGVSKITVSYNSNNTLLEDSVTIITYKPLKLLYPLYKEIVLAIGTSTNLVFSGGPRRVIGRPSDHKRIVTADDSSIVTAVDTSELHSIPGQQDISVINVLCLKLGSTNVFLAIVGDSGNHDCRNQESFAKITIFCGKPRSVVLLPDRRSIDARSCPMDLNADHVVVQSYKDLQLEVVVSDDHGRKFMNISSFKFDWVIEPQELGEINNLDGVYTDKTTIGSLAYFNRSYQLVMPKAKTGVIHVTTSIIGYKTNQLKAYGIIPEWPEFTTDEEYGKPILPISTAIHLHLVEDAIISPEIIYLYNHPNNKVYVPVLEGSGYYELALNAENIAEVRYLEGSREIEIIPLKNGELRITLRDLCLSSQPINLFVNIVSIGVIKVEMSDKVEITKCISCIVKLYDESENLLAIPDTNMINLQTNTENNIISVRKLEEDKAMPWSKGEVQYVVTGEELGETKLSFSLNEVSSTPVNLQVFPPLKIFPRNATLLLHAVLQLRSKGGPHPEANIEYKASNTEVADVSLSGLIQGLVLGHTRISATSIGTNPSNGQRVIYSQDVVDLHVRSITGIRISVPLTRFQVGATIPAWANGLPDQLSPLILGTVHPPLRFEWDVDDNEIICIHEPFKEYGINYLPEDAVSVHITGLILGRTTLHLNVVVPGKAADHSDRSHVIYSASIDVEIFEALILTAPQGVNSNVILMAPYSSVQLETNLDALNKVHYRISSFQEVTSKKNVVDKSLSISQPIVTVSDSGLLQSFEDFGKVVVTVTALDDSGIKQTLNIIAQVKPVHYMLLNVRPTWVVESPVSIDVVPLGAEFELKASYHDNTGALFTAATTQLKMRTTRYDLIRVRPGTDNSSVIVSTKKSGYTLIKGWIDDSQKTSDYLKLNVGPIITPSVEHLITGDIICAWTPVISAFKEKGNWSCNDEFFMDMDPTTGIGRVLGTKAGQIAISHSLHPSASLHLQIVPADQIEMFPLDGKMLTNAPDTPIYRVPLVLFSEKVAVKQNNLLTGWQCQEKLNDITLYHPFVCHIRFSNETNDMDISQVFFVRPGFETETGRYTCEILTTQEYTAVISTLNSNITVWTQIINSEIVSKPIEVQFLPSIFAPRLLMLDDSYIAMLDVVGLDYILNEVSIKPIEPKLLQVSEISRPEPNLLRCEISLLDYHWKLDDLDEPMSVIINSKLTNQNIKVPVKVHATDEFAKTECATVKHSPVVSLIYYYRHTIAIMLSMFTIFMITFYAYSKFIHPVINVNIAPNRSLLASSNQMNQMQTQPALPSPTRNHTCSAVLYQQRSNPNRSNFFNRDPVYGDPDSFYSTSPEIRRTSRRFM